MTITLTDRGAITDVETVDPHQVSEAIERIAALLIQVGRAYGDSSWRRFDREYVSLAEWVDDQLARLGLDSPLGVWPSLASWHAVAKQHGSYARRDAFVNARLAELRGQLKSLTDDHGAGDLLGQLDELADAAQDTLGQASGIRDQLLRIERSLDSDPGQTIGAAKNLVESTAKAVLHARAMSFDASAKLPALVSAAMKAVDAHPATEERRAVRDMLAKLAGLTHHLAELRNEVGDGHGTLIAPAGVQPRHGRLASRAAVAWCSFMLDSLNEQP